MTDAKTIADSLTEAQRRAIAHPDNKSDFWANDERVAKAVERKGLAGPWRRGGLRDWTPLGLAVRKHIQEG